MKNLNFVLLSTLCVCLVLGEHKKEAPNKGLHESKSSKHQSGHWKGKSNVKHDALGVKKHAPELISMHDARMQMDLNYNKRNRGAIHDDLHLQDLQIEDSRWHKKMQQKNSRGNHPTRNHEIYSYPKAHLSTKASSVLHEHKRIKDDGHKAKLEKEKKGGKKLLFSKKTSHKKAAKH